MTKTEAFKYELASRLKSRFTLLWVSTPEEYRVERAIIDAAASANYPVQFWDCATGLSDMEGKVIDASKQNPIELFKGISSSRQRMLYVARDLDQWVAQPVNLRWLRNLQRMLVQTPRNEARALIILSSGSISMPQPLEDHCDVLTFDRPERAEVAEILTLAQQGLPPEVALVNGERDRAVDAALGLTANQISNSYALTSVKKRMIDADAVSQDKKAVIAQSGLLKWYDPHPRGLDAVGGLDLAKPWILQRKLALSQKAREFGLPAPKGVLLVGVPGCGKSLMSKAVAAAWQVPLLRFDIGALRSKYVGESEQNLRRTLNLAETVSPCILWIDEIEKGLAGSTGPAGDGGVAADALGALLSWMQDRTGSVFVIATANNMDTLPPELLRKGRFDEIFFVDLPTLSERREIVVAALKECGRTADGIDVDAVARACDTFTGSEIAAVIPDALFRAFSEGQRALTTEDLLGSAAAVVPLSRTRSESIGRLREWAKTNARPASSPDVAAATSYRQIEV